MKRFRVFVCLALCAALLSGCSASTPAPPAVTLPPGEISPEAPLGDAGLRTEIIAPLYLPSLDGQSLLTVFEPLSVSRGQHPAEDILQALLNHPGNSRVRPLGDGAGTLALTGSDPVELSGGVCTVNLSASALALSAQELYTAALAISATLCETEGVQYVTLLVAGTPVAMDVTDTLPLGLLSAWPGQELPVLWEQMASRRTPVGELPFHTPMTATAALYFPLADGSGMAAEPRRLSFPGQHPQQQVVTLLNALSAGADLLEGAADMPDLNALLLFVPEVADLDNGGRRATLHFTADAVSRISAAGCDPLVVFGCITTTLTSFVPSLQQVCILLGDEALTSLQSPQLGTVLFPGGLQIRSYFSHLLMGRTAACVPAGHGLKRQLLSLPYRSAFNPRAVLLRLPNLSKDLTDADILGISVQSGTLLVNFSQRYGEVIRQSGMDQRLMAYSMVNTLGEMLGVRRVRFYFGGESVDFLGSDVCWSGEFLVRSGLIVP